MRFVPSAGFSLPALCACLCAVFPSPVRAEDAVTPAAPGAAKAPGTVIEGQGYAIVCPPGWTRGEGLRVDLILSCDEDPAASISVDRAPAGTDREFTEAAAREMREMLASNIPGYEVTAEEWRNVGGARAYRISARYTLGSGTFRVAMRNTQVLFIAGGNVFTITYTSTPELFMKHLGEFETALDGFRTQAAAAPGGAGERAAATPAAGKP